MDNKKIKKVLHIVGSLDESAGGPSRSVPQTCEQVSKLGLKIELISRPSDKPVKINTSKLFQVNFYSTINIFAYCMKLSKKEISLIHLQHVWDPYIHIVAFFARLKGIPYIITPRGMLEPWIMKQRSWKKKLGLFLYQKKDLKKAAVIHATCKLEETNVRNLGFTNPITIIPNGVDISKFPTEEPIKTDQPRKILFLSRIHPKKGIELLIEAWSQLTSDIRKDWVLEIVGNGDANYIKSLQEKIAKQQLEQQLFIKEPVFGEKKMTLFRESTLFVLPTYSENFGIVVAEALASFTPVITTTGTPWEELNTHKCGWWIDLSVENLRVTLQAAMQKSPEEMLLMGLNGRKLVEENYDVKVVAQNMLKLYHNILDK
ncbi:Glycosyltransferase involved in cell wall bisynthesis [Polaribacter sp. KT25b]|uniref:glycosyltransferase n=1 Tax=Polaribacter sp. KT25b TaxID=1855336 RepID=UPI00087B0B5E|nr:glycosyltransferase [Polaribacter sp. KT25b]SDS26481.1 Glycosyltransferase involved in cell wall bisynthesis [Polaribacter sp. KT25b]